MAATVRSVAAMIEIALNPSLSLDDAIIALRMARRSIYDMYSHEPTNAAALAETRKEAKALLVARLLRECDLPIE